MILAIQPVPVRSLALMVRSLEGGECGALFCCWPQNLAQTARLGIDYADL